MRRKTILTHLVALAIGGGLSYSFIRPRMSHSERSWINLKSSSDLGSSKSPIRFNLKRTDPVAPPNDFQVQLNVDSVAEFIAKDNPLFQYPDTIPRGALAALLALTPEEKDKWVTTIRDKCEVLHNLEKQHSRELNTIDGDQLIEVTPFPERADEVKEELLAELRAEFGAKADLAWPSILATDFMREVGALTRRFGLREVPRDDGGLYLAIDTLYPGRAHSGSSETFTRSDAEQLIRRFGHLLDFTHAERYLKPEEDSK